MLAGDTNSTQRALDGQWPPTHGPEEHYIESLGKAQKGANPAYFLNQEGTVMSASVDEYDAIAKAMRIVIIPDLTLSPLGPGELARIEAAAGEGSIVIQLDSDAEALQAARSMQVLFGQLTPELFAAAPALEWVHSTSSGIDHLLFPAFKESDVVLTGEKGLVGPHLADHAMGLLLALTRKIAAAVRDGPDSWAHRVEYRMAELELEGLKLCVVGFGGTGRCIAKRAAGFDMHVSAIDLNPVEGTTEASTVEPMSALPDRLAEADVVAVCLPLTPETREMFDARMFERMKPGAILINVTRGEIIDHRAMLAALESGRLGGAGLDVHYREPLPADDPMWRHSNVVMTPHTAGASQLRTGRNYGRFLENVARFRRGDTLLGEVDKKLGF